MDRRRTIAALVFPVLCVAAGSQILACLNDLRVQEPPADGGEDVAQVCAHATPPLPPAIADDTSNDVTFVTAIRTVRFKSTAGGDPLGFDLDRYCTCQGEPASCIAPAGQDEDLECDMAQGRDNAAPRWIRLVELILLFDPEGDQLTELYSNAAELGRWSVLMRVSGYNGKPDDSNVRVDWFPSPGMPSPPQWNGTDTWPISVDAVIPDAGPRYFDTSAYVTNNNLVFALPEGIVRMSSGLTNLNIHVTNVTAMATIEKSAMGQYDLRSGNLAGHIPMEDLFKMVTEFRDHNGQAFCTNSNPYYLTFRDALCRMPDIQGGSSNPNKPCTAVSFAMGFEAYPIADVAGPEAPSMMPTNCAPGEDPYSVFLDAGCPVVSVPDAGN